MITGAAKEAIPPTFLTAAAVQLYLFQAGTNNPNAYARIIAWSLSNQDSIGHAVTFNKVPPAGAVANSNIIMPASVIPANTLWSANANEDGEYWIIPNGGSFYAFADLTNKVVITMTVREYVG